MVVWRNQGHTTLFRNLPREDLSVIADPVVKHYLRTVTARRIDFYCWCIIRHADHGWRTEQLCRQCNTLRVVAGGECENTALARLQQELANRVVCAAKFECS